MQAQAQAQQETLAQSGMIKNMANASKDEAIARRELMANGI